MLEPRPLPSRPVEPDDLAPGPFTPVLIVDPYTGSPYNVPLPTPTETPMPPTSEPTLLERLAAVKLFKIPGWLVFGSAALAWGIAAFFGVADVNVAAWAGADQVLTLGELAQGLLLVVGGATAAKAAKTEDPAEPTG